MNKTNPSLSAGLLGAIMLFVANSAHAIVYVDATAVGANDGSSWIDAFTTLQDALNATSDDEIWVAAGTYRPAPPNGDRNATFQLKSGVAVYGGFSGSETARDQRDPDLNATILSGDLNDDDVYRWVNFHASYYNAGENSYHVVTASGTDATALLDGFSVVHGYAYPSGFQSPAIAGGGGLLIVNAGPSIRRTSFDGNAGAIGGAAYIYDGNPTFTDCSFTENYADIGRGGAVYSGGNSQLSFNRTTFRANAAIGSSIDPDGNGGAIYIDFGSLVTIADSVFDGNLTSYRRLTTGGTPTTGGAIMAGGDLTVENSFFLANTSHNGGAIYAYNNLTVVNTIFSGNEANAAPSNDSLPSGGYGGAVVAGDAEFHNSVFGGNKAGENAGGIYVTGGTTQISNSILWGNVVTKYIPPGEDPIPTSRTQVHKGSGNASIACSIVQGLFEPIPGEDPPNPADFPGSLDADPMFANPAGDDSVVGTEDDNLRLTQASPAIDAGNNDLVPQGVIFDLDGNDRFADDPVVADTGVGTPPIVDMGAYEFSSGPATNVPPVASASANPTSGDVSLTVSFSSAGSNDPDGGTLTFLWDFGDGGSSTEADPVHVYNSAGTFTAQLTVTDDDGATDAASVTINVTQPTNPLPLEPVIESALDNMDGSATITWNDYANNEDGFEVERESWHKKRGKWVGTALVATPGPCSGPAPCSASITDASGTGSFRYRVRAVNAVGASAWANWIEVTVTNAGGGGNGGGGKGGGKGKK